MKADTACYMYKQGEITYICDNTEDEYFKNIPLFHIGDHVVMGEVLNGDEFEDGEEFSNTTLEVDCSDEEMVTRLAQKMLPRVTCTRI